MMQELALVVALKNILDEADKAMAAGDLALSGALLAAAVRIAKEVESDVARD